MKRSGCEDKAQALGGQCSGAKRSKTNNARISPTLPLANFTHRALFRHRNLENFSIVHHQPPSTLSTVAATSRPHKMASTPPPGLFYTYHPLQNGYPDVGFRLHVLLPR